MAKPHDLEDREYLRTLTTAHLTKLWKNTTRSIDELIDYQEALNDVLAERERERAGEP